MGHRSRFLSADFTAFDAAFWANKALPEGYDFPDFSNS
jgi:hypothetical protein